MPNIFLLQKFFLPLPWESPVLLLGNEGFLTRNHAHLCTFWVAVTDKEDREIFKFAHSFEN